MIQHFLLLIILISCVSGAPCVTWNKNGVQSISCSYNSTSVSDGIVNRGVYYAIPEGKPPSTGWPVVMMYQGSFFPAVYFFSGSQTDMFGGFYQVQTVQALLNSSFAVVAPDAMFDGLLFWDTNLPPWNTIIDLGLWPTAPDAVMLSNLFPMMASGKLGPLDMTRVHSAGISSGGYMSSRMAFFYPHQFRSVTIAAGSFYYCTGALCSPPIQGFPGELKPDHPPTLFLQGEDDIVVPIFTMWMYADDLKTHKIPYRVATCANCTHQWIPSSPVEVLNWVQKWNN